MKLGESIEKGHSLYASLRRFHCLTAVSQIQATYLVETECCIPTVFKLRERLSRLSFLSFCTCGSTHNPLYSKGQQQLSIFCGITLSFGFYLRLSLTPFLEQKH